VSLKAFFANHTGNKYRVAAVGGTLLLCAIALVLIFSITGALLNLPFIALGLGDFFVRSYGFLSFLIPAYLIWAAIILADPGYRPERIYVLATAIVPFMTLAIGIGFIQDFNAQANRIAILQKSGKQGLSVFVVLLTFVEVMIIRASIPLVFSKAKPVRQVPDPKAAGPSPAVQETVSVQDKTEYSGIPAEFSGDGLTAGGSSPVGGPAGGPQGGPAGKNGAVFETAAANSFPVTYLLPQPRPLASARAFKELERVIQGKIVEQDEAPYAGIPEEPEYPEETDESPDEVEEEIEDLEELDPLAEETAIKERPIPVIESIPPIQAEPVFVPLEGSRAKPAPKKKFRDGRYQVPVEGILQQYPDGQYWITDQATRDAAMILEKTLEEFNIQAEVTGIKKGPVITMFEILPAPGVKLQRIVGLQDNIALRLAASSVRIVAPIPGKHAVGIEVPNKKRNIVSFREIIEGELKKDSKAKKLEIPVVLGKGITGEAVTADLATMPHLLIAGATGSGQSVCVNSIILSVLYQRSPAECRLILIDPKIVELKLYNDIPHLLTPVITEPKRAFQALQYCIYEMERRYACLDSMGVRDIKSYNKRIKERSIATEHMPYIIVLIDEFADLMATTGKELESTVARLAAMSRAVGIHLVLATQRPSIDVITGLIKANIPSRIAFMVASKMDSRIIIDQVGAEKLLGKGDMLYAGAVDPFPVRMQGAFISEEEVEKVVEYVKTLGEPDYIDDEIFYDDDDEGEPSLFSEGDDPLYEKALEIVTQQGKASASYIQRRLKVGYNRAARIVEEMARQGLVGPAQGSKPRELLRGA
jgi:S-DNA-T family DNA segregation ATPase FtsK/SpoIIIE